MSFVLGVIPARGGSKGIPGKNIRPLGGVPVIAHSIRAARDCGDLDDCLVSTDSREIADCAAAYGMPVRRLRDAELATDTATTVDAVIHEVENYERDTGRDVGVVVLLQPTTPLRRAEDIAGGLERFRAAGAGSLISVYEARSAHPEIMYYQEEGRLRPVLDAGKTLRRRQNFQPAYVRNGALYITTRDRLFSSRAFLDDAPVPYVMPWERSVNLDEPFDLEMAEWLLRRNA